MLSISLAFIIVSKLLSTLRVFEIFNSFEIDSLPVGNQDKLEKYEKDTIKAVLGHYGSKEAQWLSDLSHLEKPWNQARKGKKPGENSTREISHAAMVEYYSSL